MATKQKSETPAAQEQLSAQEGGDLSQMRSSTLGMLQETIAEADPTHQHFEDFTETDLAGLDEDQLSELQVYFEVLQDKFSSENIDEQQTEYIEQIVAALAQFLPEKLVREKCLDYREVEEPSGEVESSSVTTAEQREQKTQQAVEYFKYLFDQAVRDHDLTTVEAIKDFNAGDGTQEVGVDLIYKRVYEEYKRAEMDDQSFDEQTETYLINHMRRLIDRRPDRQPTKPETVEDKTQELTDALITEFEREVEQYNLMEYSNLKQYIQNREVASLTKRILEQHADWQFNKNQAIDDFQEYVARFVSEIKDGREQVTTAENSAEQEQNEVAEAVAYFQELLDYYVENKVSNKIEFNSSVMLGLRDKLKDDVLHRYDLKGQALDDFDQQVQAYYKQVFEALPDEETDSGSTKVNPFRDKLKRIKEQEQKPPAATPEQTPPAATPEAPDETSVSPQEQQPQEPEPVKVKVTDRRAGNVERQTIVKEANQREIKETQPEEQDDFYPAEAEAHGWEPDGEQPKSITPEESAKPIAPEVSAELEVNLEQARIAYYQARMQNKKPADLEPLRQAYEAALRVKIEAQVDRGNTESAIANQMLEAYQQEEKQIEELYGEHTGSWWEKKLAWINKQAGKRMAVGLSMLGANTALWGVTKLAPELLSAVPVVGTVTTITRIPLSFLGGVALAEGLMARSYERGITTDVYNKLKKKHSKGILWWRKTDHDAIKQEIPDAIGNIELPELQKELSKLRVIAERKGGRRQEVFGAGYSDVAEAIYQKAIVEMAARFTRMEQEQRDDSQEDEQVKAQLLNSMLDDYLGDVHLAEEAEGRKDKAVAKRRMAISLAAGTALAAFPANRLITGWGGAEIADASGVDSELMAYNTPPAVDTPSELDMAPDQTGVEASVGPRDLVLPAEPDLTLAQEFGQSHALLEATGAEIQVEAGGPIQVTYEIGAGKDFAHLDQALRRLVVQEFNVGQDNTFSALEAGQAENVLANLRTLLEGNPVAGFKPEDIKGVVSYADGKLVVQDYEQFEGLYGKLLGHAQEIITEESGALDHINATSVKNWEKMFALKDSVNTADVDFNSFVSDAGPTQPGMSMPQPVDGAAPEPTPLAMSEAAAVPEVGVEVEIPTAETPSPVEVQIEPDSMSETVPVETSGSLDSLYAPSAEVPAESVGEAAVLSAENMDHITSEMLADMQTPQNDITQMFLNNELEKLNAQVQGKLHVFKEITDGKLAITLSIGNEPVEMIIDGSSVADLNDQFSPELQSQVATIVKNIVEVKETAGFDNGEEALKFMNLISAVQDTDESQMAVFYQGVKCEPVGILAKEYVGSWLQTAKQQEIFEHLLATSKENIDYQQIANIIKVTGKSVLPGGGEVFLMESIVEGTTESLEPILGDLVHSDTTVPVVDNLRNVTIENLGPHNLKLTLEYGMRRPQAIIEYIQGDRLVREQFDVSGTFGNSFDNALEYMRNFDPKVRLEL